MIWAGQGPFFFFFKPWAISDVLWPWEEKFCIYPVGDVFKESMSCNYVFLDYIFIWHLYFGGMESWKFLFQVLGWEDGISELALSSYCASLVSLIFLSVNGHEVTCLPFTLEFGKDQVSQAVWKNFASPKLPFSCCCVHGTVVITKLVPLSPLFLSLTCCGVLGKWSEPFLLNINKIGMCIRAWQGRESPTVGSLETILVYKFYDFMFLHVWGGFLLIFAFPNLLVKNF